MSETKKVAYIFPGQGAQTVGMGKDLYDNFDSVKLLFKQADEAVGFPLTKIFFEGPEEELKKTSNAQPALVAVSIACLKAAQEVGGKNLPAPSYTAGHSLGEYTALAATSVIDFSTAVYLAKERGRLMYEAGLKTPGGMMAMIGIEEAVLAEICKETSDCQYKQSQSTGDQRRVRKYCQSRGDGQSERGGAGNSTAGQRRLPFPVNATGRRRHDQDLGESKFQRPFSPYYRQRDGATFNPRQPDQGRTAQTVVQQRTMAAQRGIHGEERCRQIYRNRARKSAGRAGEADQQGIRNGEHRGCECSEGATIIYPETSPSPA